MSHEITPSVLSMSSREISDLTGKQHAHVVRDIRAMLAQIHGIKDDPNLDDIDIKGVSFERDARNYISLARLDKDHTLTLLTGYDAKARFRVVQRWQELEASKPPELSREQILVMALESERERVRLAHKLEAVQPMVQFHEEVAQAEGEFAVDEACALLFNGSIPAKQLRNWLYHQGWFDGRPAMRNKPSSWAIHRGYLRLRLDTVNGRAFSVPVFTASGLELLRHLYRTGELFTATIPADRLMAAPERPA
jgi:phage antirepressor YoqD-like protein